MSNIGLYVHIPFCESKCLYCNFISSCYNENIQEKYFSKLQDEIESKKMQLKNPIIKTIYFGGGTPSCVNKKYISKTIKNIYKNFNISKNAEISIECNPNTVDEKKLIFYHKLGFNRISFGAQSFDNSVLKTLGRVHNSTQIFDAITFAKKAGFNNINIDLIIGVKKLDKMFAENVKKALNLGITHISVYMLILEKDTPLFKKVKSKELDILSEDESVEDYNRVVKILKKLKLNRYEVSNFCLKNFECKHNLNYWNCGDYLGIGLNSHSYLFEKRQENIDEINNYLIAKNNFIKSTEIINNQQKVEEYIMLALRTNKGINIKRLNKLNYNILKIKEKELNYLKNKKIINITKNNIKIMPNYYGVLNQIILKLI